MEYVLYANNEFVFKMQTAFGRQLFIYVRTKVFVNSKRKMQSVEKPNDVYTTT